MMLNKIRWPEGKKSAVMLSIELDGEFVWISMDPSIKNRPKSLSVSTYGWKRGFERVMNVLEESKLKATFFVPGIVAEKYPEKVKKIHEAGHEIALHGYEHENFGLLSREEQEEAIKKGIASIEKLTGCRPVGFRAPEGEVTPETMQILKEQGFIYDSSFMDSDIPYTQGDIDGDEQLVEIPMRYEMSDFVAFAYNWSPEYPLGESRIAGFAETLDNWKDELKAYNDYGLCCVPRFDPQIIGHPGRIELLREILYYISVGDRWIATGKEIANYLIANEEQV